MKRPLVKTLMIGAAGTAANVAWLVALFGNSVAKGVFKTTILAACYGATHWIRASTLTRLVLGSAAIALIQAQPWKSHTDMIFSGIGPLQRFGMALIFAPFQAAPLIFCWISLVRNSASPRT